MNLQIAENRWYKIWYCVLFATRSTKVHGAARKLSHHVRSIITNVLMTCSTETVLKLLTSPRRCNSWHLQKLQSYFIQYMATYINVSLALDDGLRLQWARFTVAKAEIEGIKQAGGHAELFQYDVFCRRVF